MTTEREAIAKKAAWEEERRRMRGATTHHGLHGRWRCMATIVTRPCMQFAVVVHNGEVLCASCGAPALGAAKLLGLVHRTEPSEAELRVMRAAAAPDDPPAREPEVDDYAVCLAIQRRGLMYSHDGVDPESGRETVLFDLTDAGRAALRKTTGS